jgi:hypothetical protein
MLGDGDWYGALVGCKLCTFSWGCAVHDILTKPVFQPMAKISIKTMSILDPIKIFCFVLFCFLCNDVVLIKSVLLDSRAESLKDERRRISPSLGTDN